MISFKQYLREVADNQEPQYTERGVVDAIEILNAHCKDALWMLENDTPLWRGERAFSNRDDNWENRPVKRNSFITVDPSKTERRSQNTSNYYTVILDNIPSMKDFPKRSRSFICSTNYDVANGYGAAMAVIPYDGVKIGVCPGSDMWDTQVNLWNHTWDISSHNGLFEHLFDALELNENWASFKEIAATLKDAKNPHYLSTLKAFFDALKYNDYTRNEEIAVKWSKSFLEDIYKAYSPEETELTCETTKTLPRTMKNNEVWVGGPVMMIGRDMWKNLVKSYKQRNNK